jgi:hypothetical protein
MKVHSITQYQYRPSFKQNDDEHVLGYDDEISKARRAYIRKWQEEHYAPYQSIYEKEGRKSEYEMNRMLSDLLRESDDVDDEKMKQIRIPNLNFLDETSYRGAMIESYDLHKVKMLQDAGILRIIYVGRGDDDLKNECEKLGMAFQAIEFDSRDDTFNRVEDVREGARRYAQYVLGYKTEEEIAEYVDGKVWRWKENTREFIDEFTKFIKNMQRGNVFIGCDYGTYSTDTAVMFDYLFNPQMRHDSGLNDYNVIFVDCAEDLYYNLTDSDKSKMGWPKDFDQVFFKRLNRLKNFINRYY